MPEQTPPPLLRDVIVIPESPSASDLVLRLADGVTNAEETLREYVIPPRLVDNFDQALRLIQNALNTGASRAAYLHASFGAGKSHFMAVLHALLRGEHAARKRDEFAPLLARHDMWLDGRKFLLVPYHMMGAKSLEQRVLGGYIEYVRKLHPDKRIPAVHRTDALLEQSQHLRAQIGDRAFIAGLPGGGEEDDWGDTADGWTSEKLDTAFAATPDDEIRRSLVNDLLSTWQRGFFRNALEDADGFVSLDRGLTEIATHAKELGYDGLVLFLDELILWLANSIGDQRFVSREIQKITNFVEGGDAHRPIPVITFIARQRDLRELVGEAVTGAHDLAFQDTLNLASGRFDVITLEDRNLPEITRKRLLKRVGGDGSPADQAITEAFERVRRVRSDVWDVLLGTDTGSGADLESFRLTYPFSPAFISTLVYVSSALQRSRTGLKLMRQLLVERRDELRLGQLIPLGDLYDVLSRGGDQPFTDRLKVEFETAQKLYQNQLRPYLMDQHNVSDDDLDRARHGEQLDPALAGRVRAFTGDDRLIKTLLLAALAPSVPALHNLTPRKLSALNHGSITSPIPGGEVGLINRRIEQWAARFGEIKMLDGDGVQLELVGVDVGSVLNNARHFDTLGGRQNMVKRLLWEELGVTATESYFDQAHLIWRGSRRTIEVVYGNIRDPDQLREDAFHPFTPNTWRLVIDYPFDEGTHSPAEDRNRVLGFSFTARTVCWIPATLTVNRQTDLGRLVTLDALLSGPSSRFELAAKHLSEDDRRRAHATLTNQRDALLVAMKGVLRQAYGVANKQAADVLTTYTDHLISLTDPRELTLPVGAKLSAVLPWLADQMLSAQYPAHPDFDPDRRGESVRAADLRTVLEYVRRAVESGDDRVEVEKKDRAVLRRIVNPLGLGEMHEAAYVLDRQWVEHFQHRANQEGITSDIRVTDLVRWLDEPKPRGLEPLVAQLVMAAFAEQTDRTWVRHGSVMTPQPELSAINNDLALRTPERPDEDDWSLARDRAMHLFGFMPPTLARGRLVAMFVQDLSRQARQHREAAHLLAAELERHADRLGLDPAATTGRLHTAYAARDLLDGLDSRHRDIDIVKQIAHTDLGGPPQRAGKSIRSAYEVVQALRNTSWDNFDLLAELGDPWTAEAVEILTALRQAANDDELTTPLAAALSRARAHATDLLRRVTRSQHRPPSPGDGTGRVPHQPPTPGTETTPSSGDTGPDPGSTEHGTKLIDVDDLDELLETLRKVAGRNPGRRLQVNWQVRQ
ncbi:hypothetical protein GCM10027290_55320 [Micromonospora sonneratiae]|uniref:Phage resistance protein n=1 Tax=Micromonospora sonneratiae TaxID=1184706 RepID=A0ABW3Y8F9_9ACTN